MPDLLLELFSEEIPARMQEQALQHLQTSLLSALGKEGFAVDSLSARSFVTPRRLAVIVKGLPTMQAASETELKGPKLGAPDAAVQGFLKKNGLQPSDLVERNGVYFAIIRKEGKATSGLLASLIENLLMAFPWPKSMRWGNGDVSWVRPLHSILCIFDGKIIPVSFAGITASNITRGHRFLSPAEIIINDPSDYEAALEKASVIADREKRKDSILQQAVAIAVQAQLQLKKDDGLLEEVTGLVEWPVVLAGQIDAGYMDLPKEVLVSEMRAHQKYFALENADGSLSSTFLIASNMQSEDGGKAIIAGNERVLRARLADGRFFWDQDRKKTLDDWAKGLKTVTYHAKLGTIADKVERIQALALQLADHIPNADKKQVERAATLCKADLVTGMVGEFPDLQGVMGRYYALHQGEKPEVADAIRDHYKPQGPNDAVPNQGVSICVALADKLDTLISMFAIGEKPTGSKDPFALRRAALGIIRIILENHIRLPLKLYFAQTPVQHIALHQAHEKLAVKTEARMHEAASSHRVGKYLTVNETTYQDLESAVPAHLPEMLYAFLIDRLKVQLKDIGIRHDIINAVVAGGDDDLVRIVARAKALQEFLESNDGQNLLAGYKRASNILAIEEKKDNIRYQDIIAIDAYTLPEEQALKQALTQTLQKVEPLLQAEDFISAMTAFSMLRAPVDRFFDKVLVNDADPAIRKNRLCLLAELRQAFSIIADFSLIGE